MIWKIILYILTTIKIISGNNLTLNLENKIKILDSINVVLTNRMI